MTVDRDRLIKLLNLTESAHDGESLNAIRASNALMRQSKMTWTDLIAVARHRRRLQNHRLRHPNQSPSRNQSTTGKNL